MNDHTKNPAMEKYIAAYNGFNDLVGRMANLAAAMDELKDQMKDDPDISVQEIAEFYFHLSDAHERADKAVKRVYHYKDMLNKYLIPSKLEAVGLDKIQVASIARSFSSQQKMSASFIDKEAGFEWLRGIGQEDIIQETVNAGTLAAFVRNMILEEGKEPPEGIVRVSTYSTTSMTKYTPKKKV